MPNVGEFTGYTLSYGPNAGQRRPFLITGKNADGTFAGYLFANPSDDPTNGPGAYGAPLFVGSAQEHSDQLPEGATDTLGPLDQAPANSSKAGSPVGTPPPAQPSHDNSTPFGNDNSPEAGMVRRQNAAAAGRPAETPQPAAPGLPFLQGGVTADNADEWRQFQQWRSERDSGAQSGDSTAGNEANDVPPGAATPPRPDDAAGALPRPDYGGARGNPGDAR